MVENAEAADEVLVRDTGALLETIDARRLLVTVEGNIGALSGTISEGNEAHASSKQFHLQNMFVESISNITKIRDRLNLTGQT